MPNEVKILVRVYNSGKAGLDAAQKDMDDYAKRFSETFSKRFSESITQSITQNLRTVGERAQQSAREAGDRIGNTMSERITTRITDRIRNTFRSGDSRSTSSSRSDSGGNGGGDRDRVHVDVDVDKKSLLQQISDVGKQAGDKLSGFFGDGLKTGLSSVFSGDVISTVLKGALISFAAFNLAPVLASTIGAAVLLALGGGFIGAGLVAAFQGPEVQGSFKKLKAGLKDAFSDFGVSFIGPIQHFADGLLGVFKQIKPMVDHLGVVFGPITDELASGIIGLLQSLLPAILRGIEASGPIIQVLADNLPGIGDALGRFFDDISQRGPEVATFFNDLLHVVQIVIRLLGNLVSVLIGMYSVARNVLIGIIQLFLNWGDAIITTAAYAFSWVPGLGPKLQHAAEGMKDFKNKFNNYLKQIPSSKTFTLHLNVVGIAAANAAVRTARILKGLDHGGVQGADDGGLKSGMTWVGEHGPELVQLPPGAQVNTTGDSARMAGTGGGGNGGRLDVRFSVSRSTERGLAAELLRVLRVEIGDNYSGNAQMALGR